jgi:hypothetical protein
LSFAQKILSTTNKEIVLLKDLTGQAFEDNIHDDLYVLLSIPFMPVPWYAFKNVQSLFS